MSFSQNSIAAAQIPLSVMRNRYLVHTMKRIAAGGEKALRQFIERGATLPGMDQFWLGRSFIECLTEQELARLGSCVTPARYSLFVTLAGAEDGSILITANGNKIGTAISLPLAKQLVMECLPDKQLIVEGDGMYLSLSDDGEVGKAKRGTSSRSCWRLALDAATACVEEQLTKVELAVSGRVVYVKSCAGENVVVPFHCESELLAKQIGNLVEFAVGLAGIEVQAS